MAGIAVALHRSIRVSNRHQVPGYSLNTDSEIGHPANRVGDCIYESADVIGEGKGLRIGVCDGSQSTLGVIGVADSIAISVDDRGLEASGIKVDNGLVGRTSTDGRASPSVTIGLDEKHLSTLEPAGCALAMES